MCEHSLQSSGKYRSVPTRSRRHFQIPQSSVTFATCCTAHLLNQPNFANSATATAPPRRREWMHRTRWAHLCLTNAVSEGDLDPKSWVMPLPPAKHLSCFKLIFAQLRCLIPKHDTHQACSCVVFHKTPVLSLSITVGGIK